MTGKTSVHPEPVTTVPQTTRHRPARAELRVLIVGAGGLGSPAAAHLTAEGVGIIGIIDADLVDLSNLHRQLLHGVADLGRPKVDSARESLESIAPGVRIEAIHARLDPTNAERLFARYDFIIDGSDNFPTKFLVNDTALLVGTPFSHAGVVGFIGQTMTVIPGQSACYRCIFSTEPEPGDIPSCQEAGILGPVAGMIGAIQAGQALAWAGDTPDLLVDRLLTYDALDSRWRAVHVRRNPRCPACAASGTSRSVAAGGTR
jgi:molybdopterin/thiamine biosynthesis adenylyltransferase